MKQVCKKQLFFWGLYFFLGICLYCSFSYAPDGRPSLSTYGSGMGQEPILRHLHLAGQERKTSMTLAFSAQYGRTFKSEKIAHLLFRTAWLPITGSAVPDRDNKHDLLADYFGLPRDFKSIMHFRPVISEFNFSIDGLMGVDAFVEGLFWGFHVPIKSTKWELNMHEQVIDAGTAFHPAGYMGPERIERPALAPNATMALHGQMISPLSGQVVPLRYGDMQDPLSFGVFENRSEKVGFGDIRLMSGWKKQYDWSHAGLLAVVFLPTSNRRTGALYLQPLLGNGKHWELGGGFTGHVDLFKQHEDTRSLGVYVDALFTHIFPSWEIRCFNLSHLGLANRYMLLEELSSNGYQARLSPLVNKMALGARIDVLIRADVTAKFVYVHDAINLEVGYNFLANTHERLKDHGSFDGGRYALKGDAQVYGFHHYTDSPQAVQATQHLSYLNRGQVPGNTTYKQIYGSSLRTAFENINADAPIAVVPDLYQVNTADSVALDPLNPLPQAAIYESVNPILVQDADVDYAGALFPKSLSHRFFVHVSKLFSAEDAPVKPSLGFGFLVETAGTSYATNSALSKWGMVINGSLYW